MMIRYLPMNRPLILSVLCMVLLTGGCQHPSGGGISQGDVTPLRRIAVVPFQQIRPEDAGQRAIRHPLSVANFVMEMPADSPSKIVENIFITYLKAYKKFEIVYPERTGGTFVRNASTSLKITTAEVLKKAGEELQADGIIVGFIYRFRERKGLPYAVEKAASVAFDIHLFRVSDGALIWRGNFDETQTSLMENVLEISLFLKERGRWVTAEELAEAGIERILETFPGLK